VELSIHVKLPTGFGMLGQWFLLGLLLRTSHDASSTHVAGEFGKMEAHALGQMFFFLRVGKRQSTHVFGFPALPATMSKRFSDDCESSGDDVQALKRARSRTTSRAYRQRQKAERKSLEQEIDEQGQHILNLEARVRELTAELLRQQQRAEKAEATLQLTEQLNAVLPDETSLGQGPSEWNIGSLGADATDALQGFGE